MPDLLYIVYENVIMIFGIIIMIFGMVAKKIRIFVRLLVGDIIGKNDTE